jgi:hypothetical protein
MKKGRFLLGRFLMGLAFFGPTAIGYSLTPMEFYNSLVAGGDDPGYRDGSFSEARFNQPAALAFNYSGTQLFVADTNNNCVRVIHLDKNNLVETLAGSTTSGKNDGSFSQSSFDKPSALALLPDNRMVVFDSGTHLLRMVDLKSQTVSTLAGTKPENTIGLIWNMVYQPKDKCLYFSEIDTQRLRKFDFKSSVISTVFEHNAQVPRPTALCLFQDQLYVADHSLPGLFRVDIAATTTQTPASLTQVVTKGENILELTSTNNVLYAYQIGSYPLAELLPDYRPVTLTTTWGFMIDNENRGVTPFISLRENVPVAFIGSPTQAHKLYVTLPYGQSQSVLSIKDYNFEQQKYSADPYDFNYPEVKPPNTFRILVLSDSRMVRSTTYIPGLTSVEDQKKGEFGDVLYEKFVHSLRINTFSKQLEFMLNREAALKGSPIHYEVLMDAHIGNSLSEYICYDIPPYVKKYDIDLVIGLAGWPGYKNFFQRPLDADGIPSATFDAQYLLKPLADRTPPGAPAKFYAGLLKKKLVKEGKEPSPGPPSEPDSLAIIREMDTDIRDNMIEMDGQVLKTFVKRLKAIDAPKDHPRNFLIFLAPWWDWYNLNDKYEAYWRDVCERNHLNFLDLDPAFYNLEPSFYPSHDSFADGHYNIYGNQLIAYLLSYYLPEQKWVP